MVIKFSSDLKALSLRKTEKRKTTTIVNENENKEDDKKGILILPFIQGITDCTSGITNRFQFKTVFEPKAVIGSLFRSPKNKLPGIASMKYHVYVINHWVNKKNN